ncbi:phytoene/squalene synthase family protein [Bacillus sp. 2205SS5-2]|uniref:phytoene/squalene synthase family protein n=1 Tax=Bacillus sp. 2205SS5-2 TaxID=3109031 RepID=UPI0030074BB4
MKISAAYAQCEVIIKENSKTFYRAFSLLPKRQKKAVWAIYAFCRMVDDIVDEHEHPQEELARFEKQFSDFLKGLFEKENPMWVALNDVFERFPLNIEVFWDMIKGQRMDIQERNYETVDDVLDYSYHVAGTVGLMLLPVLAPNNEHRLRQGAIHLGYAMQLTNILRDIGEDLDRNRVYLPVEVLERHQYSLKDLRQRKKSEAFVSIWEELAQLAEYHYELALESIHLYPLYSRTPVHGAALIYRAILNEVRQNHYDVFQMRSFVTSEKKKEILAMMMSS